MAASTAATAPAGESSDPRRSLPELATGPARGGAGAAGPGSRSGGHPGTGPAAPGLGTAVHRDSAPPSPIPLLRQLHTRGGGEAKTPRTVQTAEKARAPPLPSVSEEGARERGSGGPCGCLPRPQVLGITHRKDSG
ncbi:uncharacterized protein LOC127391645 [Apus apus]|uniref:uncharacterized protein LOC127391645 n=1 Tax=Apus apus TaxID=8895 RepID=UPI0021F8FFC8|nr:uncharacterized protein LOC127391645 [Apus apus]